MNKKIVILVVVVECILAILLVSVIGKAIENYFSEVDAQKIYFTDANGQKYEGGGTIEVARPDQGYQLSWVITPEKTSDKSVTFTSSKPDKVEVSETGYVNFFEDTDVSVTISTKNGKSATIILVPKRDMSSTIDDEIE